MQARKLRHQPVEVSVRIQAEHQQAQVEIGRRGQLQVLRFNFSNLREEPITISCGGVSYPISRGQLRKFKDLLGDALRKLDQCPNCAGKGGYDYQPESGPVYPVNCDMCGGKGKLR